MPSPSKSTSFVHRARWAALGLVDLLRGMGLALLQRLLLPVRGVAGLRRSLHWLSTPITSSFLWLSEGVRNCLAATPSYPRYIWRLRMSLMGIVLTGVAVGVFFFWQVSMPAQQWGAVGSFRAVAVERLVPEGFLDPAPDMRATRCTSGRINRLGRPGCMDETREVGDARTLFAQTSAAYLRNPSTFARSSLPAPAGATADASHASSVASGAVKSVKDSSSTGSSLSTGNSLSTVEGCSGPCATLAHQLWQGRWGAAASLGGLFIELGLLFFFLANGMWLAWLRHHNQAAFSLRLRPLTGSNADPIIMALNAFLLGIPLLVAPFVCACVLVGALGSMGASLLATYNHWDTLPTRYVLYAYGPARPGDLTDEGFVFWASTANQLRLAEDVNFRNTFSLNTVSTGERYVRESSQLHSLGNWTDQERHSAALPALLRTRVPDLTPQEQAAAVFLLSDSGSHDSWLDTLWNWLASGGINMVMLGLVVGLLMLLRWGVLVATRATVNVASASFDKLSERGSQLPFAQHERKELEKALGLSARSGTSAGAGDSIDADHPDASQPPPKRPAKRL